MHNEFSNLRGRGQGPSRHLTAAQFKATGEDHKALIPGQRTLSNLNETNRSNFFDSYKEYRNLCAKIEDKVDSFRAKMLLIVAQKGGQASEDDEMNLRMSKELLVQEGYFPDELEALFEIIGEAWET